MCLMNIIGVDFSDIFDNAITGKTMVARILGKLLHMVGILPTDKVMEVQRTESGW